MFIKPQSHKPQTIQKVVRGIPSSESMGVSLHRVIGTDALDHIDPFLLFEELQPTRGQGELIEHPYAGFEIITLVIEGHVRHATSGQISQIAAGGAHWITAGRGTSHGVQPTGEGTRAYQLWLNLPTDEKSQSPKARAIEAADIPAVIFQNAEARVLAGRFHGLIGPVTSKHTEPFIIDITLRYEGEINLPLPAGHQGFIYVNEGGVAIEKTLISAGQAGLLTADSGDGAGNMLNLVAGQDGARLLVVTAVPLNEPIVRYGPFVMSDHEGIKQAFIDHQNGLF